MTRNRDHANRPSALTPADRARMAAAIAAHDKRIARAAMWNRLSRLACCALAVAVAVALFYSATN